MQDKQTEVFYVNKMVQDLPGIFFIDFMSLPKETSGAKEVSRQTGRDILWNLRSDSMLRPEI